MNTRFNPLLALTVIFALLGAYFFPPNQPVEIAPVEASELCTPGANGVVLYSEKNYQGRCVTYTGNDENFTFDENFDNMALSLKFVGSYATGKQAILYELNNYAGTHSSFLENNSDFLPDDPNYQKRIGHNASSIRVWDCVPGNKVGTQYNDIIFWDDVITQLVYLENLNRPITNPYQIKNQDLAANLLSQWQTRENASMCWNPLATTWETNAGTWADTNSAGVKTYINHEYGFRATAATLSNLTDAVNPYLPYIREMLAGQHFDADGLTRALYKYTTGCDFEDIEIVQVDDDDNSCTITSADNYPPRLIIEWKRLYYSHVQIKSVRNGKCAQVQDALLTDGALIEQWLCQPLANQEWSLSFVMGSVFPPSPMGSYRIISKNSGKCLDGGLFVPLASDAVFQRGCNQELSQLWLITPSIWGGVAIRNVDTLKCLSVHNFSSANGTRLLQVTCDDWSLAQVWYLSQSAVSQSVLIHPNETKVFTVTVPPNQPFARFATQWPGSDVVMTLTTPTGRVIDRDTVAPDVNHEVGPTFETYVILIPEPGEWIVTLFGADVAPEGELVTFEFDNLEEPPPPPVLAYVEADGTLVLNMGSAERRAARHIETYETYEHFTVQQLSAELPGTFAVSAFGLTQEYSGVSRVQADADDGDDTLWLEGSDGVAFTAPATLSGGSGDDDLASGEGQDTLAGDEGDDTIRGGGSADVLTGGAGADQLQGEGGDDNLAGGSGQDSLTGSDGADTLNGDADNDELFGEAGTDTLAGNEGEDVLHGGAEADHLAGNEGADTLYGDEGADTLLGGAGNDDLHGGTGDDRLEGNEDADKLFGDDGQDTLLGGTSNDELHGGTGDDRLEGNEDADVLYGDDGQDNLFGNTGNDELHGGAGDDRLEGNEDADVLYGDDGQDTLFGNPGEDELHGGAGDDRLEGNEDADELYGDDDQDTLYGNGGNDQLHGGNGDDYLEGNADADKLYGDAGQDDLIGGSPTASAPDSADQLYGGTGHDVLAGDNAQIAHVLNNGQWVRQTFAPTATDIGQRTVQLLDVATTTSSVPENAYGNDQLFGEAGVDQLYGQGGADQLAGGGEDDYLEGNAGEDVLAGDDGQDDVIGGGSANDGVIDADRVGEGLLDAGDQLSGGTGGDVLAGDNARLTRPLAANGSWQIDPNTGNFVRQIVFFDVQVVNGPAINPATSGSDLLMGDDSQDLLFGQGNGAANDATGSDPADGVDNDRNGRENGSTTGVFDCLDGRDNDGDGQADSLDPQCLAAIDDKPGGDELHGGAGDDYLEGNHGADWLLGEAGEDDLIGGSAAGDGVVGSSALPTNLRDGHDVLVGGDEDDVLTGDNAQILRPSDPNGLNLRLVGGAFDLARRDTRMAQTPEPTGAYGHDWLGGGAGVDDLYGQLGNDYLEGNAGEDALVGDLGKIINNLLGVADGIPDPGTEQLIAPNAPFFDPGELIYQNGSLYRQVTLYAFVTGSGGAGNDTLYGGDGNDVLHGGASDDVLNGNVGDDRLFGGDGSDALWGGPNHDLLFGGYGIDYLDVLPRPARTVRREFFLADPATWYEAARVDNYQGFDLMYGGWDRDWMQADVSGPDQTEGDRMIDWAGAFNAYYRCDAAYGDWGITRQHSPSMVAFLQALAQGFGAMDTVTAGTSGFRETAIVFPTEVQNNSHPPSPDNPAHFTCGPAQ